MDEKCGRGEKLCYGQVKRLRGEMQRKVDEERFVCDLGRRWRHALAGGKENLQNSFNFDQQHFRNGARTE